MFACFSLGFSIKGDDDAREHVIPVFLARRILISTWAGSFYFPEQMTGIQVGVKGQKSQHIGNVIVESHILINPPAAHTLS